MRFNYVVYLDERGEFAAGVETPDGVTVYEITNATHMRELIEDGYMDHPNDTNGLEEMLMNFDVITKEDIVV